MERMGVLHSRMKANVSEPQFLHGHSSCHGVPPKVLVRVEAGSALAHCELSHGNTD